MSHPPAGEKPPSSSSGLSLVQIIGAALAAASSAFIASWLGVAGTIIGAFIGSVIATVGTAAYTHSLDRSTSTVRQLRRHLPDGQTSRTDPADTSAAAEGESAEDDATQVLPLEPATDAQTDAAEATTARDEDTSGPAWWRQQWANIALTAVIVLVVALASITMVEALIGKPLASLVGKSDRSGTTISNVGGGHPDPNPADLENPSDSPNDDKTDRDTDKKPDKPTEPDGTRGEDPADPSPEPDLPPDPVDPIDPDDPIIPEVPDQPDEPEDPDVPGEEEESSHLEELGGAENSLTHPDGDEADDELAPREASSLRQAPALPTARTPAA